MSKHESDDTPGLKAWIARCLRHLLLLSAIFTSGITLAETGTVILLSWDGMRHDYLERGDFPGLERMRREGISATRLSPVFPSSTFPGHVSLATGTTPEVHGILDNRMWDRERGSYAYESDASWLDAEPLWIAAERQGVTAATYFWVGSESDWRGQRATHRIAPFDGSRSEALKVDQIIKWLDRKEQRPALVMSYWSGADSVGHREGPDDPKVTTAISEQDRQLQRLLSYLDESGRWDTTTLMIVSDHGMTAVNRGVNLTDIIDASGVVTNVSGGGAVKHLFLQPGADPGPLSAALASIPEVTVLPADHPLHRHQHRAGDIIVTTAPPNVLVFDATLKDRMQRYVTDLLEYTKGSHGYDPALADMGAIFLAMGRGVSPGTSLPEVRQIDVAPTVTELLGISPPRSASGKAITLNP